MPWHTTKTLHPVQTIRNWKAQVAFDHLYGNAPPSSKPLTLSGRLSWSPRQSFRRVCDAIGSVRPIEESKSGAAFLHHVYQRPVLFSPIFTLLGIGEVAGLSYLKAYCLVLVMTVCYSQSTDMAVVRYHDVSNGDINWRCCLPPIPNTTPVV